MTKERLLEIAETAVKLSSKYGVDQAQAVAFLVDSALTRYANSQIHQNVASKRGGVAIKAVIDKKIGEVSINSLERRPLEDAVKKAVKICKVVPQNKDFKSLPKHEKWKPISGAFDKKTAECSPELRAEKVKEAIEKAHSVSRQVAAVAGSISTGSYAYAVSNSLGVSAWAKITLASMQTTVISRSRGSQGFSSAEKYSRRIRDIVPAEIGKQAAEKSIKSLNPKKIPVGEYEVILSPRAAAGLMMFLGYIGFSATAYQDGQSFVKYNLNKQVFDKKLNVKDDSRDPRSLYAFPVDGEGVPKRKAMLIDEGKVSEKSICHDSFTAGREKNAKTTGHSLPPLFGFGGRPMPFNVIISPGDSSEEEMIKDTKHGIFVTRFHYTNPVEPAKAVLTGLTRDGTFLIEKGEITKPIMNLRYTDSMLSALKAIPMIGKKLQIADEITAPTMKLEKLRFTGITQH